MVITFECSTSQKKPYKDYVVLALHADDYQWFAQCVGYFEGKGAKSQLAEAVKTKIKDLAKAQPCNNLFFLGLEKKEAQHVNACVSAYFKAHPKSDKAKQAKDALDNWGIW